MQPAGDVDWVSAHLYHGGDLDALVTGVVAPLVDETSTAGLVDGHFFLRYWDGGLHVRLRLRPARREHAGPVRDRVRHRAAAHFAAHPSTPAMSTEVYQTLAATLARGERLDHYEPGLLPNDSVRFVAYRPEHHAYGTGPALAAVERHFTESSAIALRVLRAGTTPDRRAAIALAATMTTLAVCEPDLEAAAGRVAGALHRTPAGGPLDADRSIVEAAYTRDRAALLRQARACWAGDDGPAGAVLGDWSRSVRSLHTTLTSLWAAADSPSDPDSPMGPLAAVTGADRRAVTLVLLRCAHLLNNRLGLGLDVEARLGLLVARTLADLRHGTPPRPGPAAPSEVES